ncbi:DUF192 domain-containing protein [Candidatus Pacearchaeota archaeon]|nr:DUF192 domain-containing protein [Candidatus Pacearchaeota archaeon]
MTLENKKITYYIDGKKETIEVELCNTPWKKFRGLMFRKNSPPLFFDFNKVIKLSIHSFFCKPFKAIWLDDKMHSTRVIDVKTWKPSITGRGKYLLEVPFVTKK